VCHTKWGWVSGAGGLFRVMGGGVQESRPILKEVFNHRGRGEEEEEQPGYRRGGRKRSVVGKNRFVKKRKDF